MNAEAFGRWVRAADFAELAALEHEGRLLFPETLKRRDKKGKVVETPVMVRVPRQDERAKARKEARAWCAKLGLDADKDADHFDAFDTICLCARALRAPAPPHEQFLAAEDLVREYDVRPILEIWDRVNHYDRLLSPRPEAIDEATYVALVHAVREAGTLRPLLAIGGSALDSFVLRMASDLSSSLTARSSSPSPETSTSDS